MQRFFRPAVVVLVVVAIAAALWWALRERPLGVETAVIARGPMAVTIEEDGQTRVREVYRISSPIAGNVDRTLLEVGDPVKAAKTVVATINPLAPPFMDERARAEAMAQADAARASVGVAEAELEQARSSLELAQSDYERAKRLSESQTISQASLEKSRTDVDLKQALVTSAQAAVVLRRSELASANARLMQPGDRALLDSEDRCCVHLKAPIDGVVLSIAVKSQQVIQAGALLAEIGDPRDLEIVVDLLSSDAVQIRPGTPARISGWGGQPVAATVRRVDPAGFTKVSALGIEEQRVNTILDLAEHQPALGHGFRVRVVLETWRSEQALRVPVAALFREGSDWAAFTVEDSRAKRRILKIDHMNNEVGEVTDGLEEGETVIVFPSDKIADGTLVEGLK